MTVILFGVGSTVEQLNNALCAVQYLAKFSAIVQTRLFGTSSY